jgi:hypothetical protein
MTSCPKCLVKPGYHNFVKFGILGNKDVLIYTAPAKTEDFNGDGTKLANIKIHMDELEYPWIWVLDCNNMELKHYTEISFNIGLLGLLSADKNLSEVWILRPNIWIRTTISFLQTFYTSKILSNIRYFEGTKLELFESLSKAGVAEPAAHWVIAQ